MGLPLEPPHSPQIQYPSGTARNSHSRLSAIPCLSARVAGPKLVTGILDQFAGNLQGAPRHTGSGGAHAGTEAGVCTDGQWAHPRPVEGPVHPPLDVREGFRNPQLRQDKTSQVHPRGGERAKHIPHSACLPWGGEWLARSRVAAPILQDNDQASVYDDTYLDEAVSGTGSGRDSHPFGLAGCPRIFRPLILVLGLRPPSTWV